MKKMINFRNIFLLLVASCVMLTSAPLMAQDSHDDCVIDPPQYDPEPDDNNVWCYTANYAYRVRIAFHIVQSSSGRGGTTAAELDLAIAILKQDFANSGISFDIVSTDYIANSAYFNDNAYKLPTTATNGAYPTPPLFFQLVAEKVVPKALNVYLGPSSNTNDGGIAWKSQRACTIAGTRVERSGTNYLVTSHGLSHEVAHLLGLDHTFLKTFGKEKVNGQDCGTTGDLICDTPADPSEPKTDNIDAFDFRPLLSNCQWNNATKRDVNGDLYRPLTNNIMAYTHVSCMSNFTSGQFRKMYNQCLTSLDLKPAVTILFTDVRRCTGRDDKGGGGGSSTYMKTLFKTEDLKFRVFPNPASEFLAVQFLSDAREMSVQITDIMGKSLYQRSLGKTIKSNIHEIDLSTLPKGVHILTVSNELDKQTTKIVIQ
jgi:Secretion system C-terminal sorting domain/Pregnancy-associated plasma protein-A